MRPMLATRGEAIPTAEAWSHEVKWDGMRVLADSDGARWRLTSRTGNDVTVAFPELQELTGPDALVDGEIVALAEGRPSFGALQERLHVQRAARARVLAARVPVTFVAFDLLRHRDHDLTSAGLDARRKRLTELGLVHERWQVPPAYDDGLLLWEATREQGLEGIVSKRRDSRYEAGQRSRNWLKFPHRLRESFVVGGWRTETDSAGRLGAILVGSIDDQGDLVYRGRVGSGLAGRKGALLNDLLAPLSRGSSPFGDPLPLPDANGARWVDPVVVVEIESLGATAAGRLRQPTYRGVRPA